MTETLTSTACGQGVQGRSEILVGGLPTEFAERVTIQFLRAKWMRAIGAPEQDIAEYCNLAAHPGSVNEELENLRDLETLQIKNLSREDLEKLSRRFTGSPMR